MVEEIYRVIIPPEARQQVKFISDYIAQDNPERALSFGRELIEKAKSLAHSPNVGVPYRRYKESGLRFVTHGKKDKYLIIYKVIESEKQVQIRSVWHGSRKPPKL